MTEIIMAIAVICQVHGTAAQTDFNYIRDRQTACQQKLVKCVSQDDGELFTARKLSECIKKGGY
jgi:hypothetical protein